MNEKIKALIELATETVPLYYGPAGISHTKKFNREKFAELIVQECIVQVSSLMDYTSYVDGGNQAIELKALRDARQVIKEHFGVK